MKLRLITRWNRYKAKERYAMRNAKSALKYGNLRGVRRWLRDVEKWEKRADKTWRKISQR